MISATHKYSISNIDCYFITNNIYSSQHRALNITNIQNNWVRPWEKCVLCHMRTTKAQISLRGASAQSDLRLCCSLLRKYNISRFYSRNFKTLAVFCGCAGRFVSGLVGNSRRHVLSWRGSITFVTRPQSNRTVKFYWYM